MASEAASAAALGFMEDVLEDVVSDGNMSDAARQNAAHHLAEIRGAVSAEQPTSRVAPPSIPQPAVAQADRLGNALADAQPEAQPAPEAAPEATDDTDPVVDLNLTPELPDELADLLDDPDEDLLPVDLAEPDEPEDEEDLDLAYESDATKKLARENERLKKQLEHQNKLRIQAARPKWEKEAAKYFPLSESSLSSIKAESRRAFLREAKSIHDQALKIVTPILDKIREENKTVRDTVVQDARQEAKERWGRPVSPVNSAPAAPEREARLQRARRSGDFTSVVREMIFPD